MNTLNLPINNRDKMKIAVAVTGASGSIYAKLLLQKIKALSDANEQIQTDLVWSKNAFTVWKEELEDERYKDLPFKS